MRDETTTQSPTLTQQRILAKRQPSSWERDWRARSREIPEDLLQDSKRRLGTLAIAFAVTYLFAGFILPGIGLLIEPELNSTQWNHWANWLPGVIGISASIAMVFMSRAKAVRAGTFLKLGLVYQVIFCYTVAAAEYLGRTFTAEQMQAFGLSWVAVCVVFFAIVVPATPRQALITALASASSVLVVFAIGLTTGQTTIGMPYQQFFLMGSFVYLIVTALAYTGARILYRLRIEIGQAREMGNYRLVELLGRGGMGEVWRAEHRMLARPAAVKLVRPETLVDERGDRQRTALRRFELEAQTTASLRSPNTIDLYDFGLSEDQTLYYVMELLDGFDTDSLVRNFGPIEPARAIHILRQVCHSLGEAHEHGLIHRDIKPANVYVCRYGRDVDFVKVLDFGLVKARHRSEESGRLTIAEGVSGTPAFMAPEQILGDRPVDARTDLYAVGCYGYWLLTGKLVFEGETPMKIMMRHVNDVPAPPSSQTELAVPLALDRILLQCLEKDPAKRPASADELSAVLSAGVGGTEWTSTRARKWWDVHHPPAVPAPH